MRKFAIFLVIIVALLASSVYFKGATKKSDSPALNQQQLSTQSTQAPQSTPVVQQSQLPVELSIPKIQINTNIESVGLDSQSRMDVPKNVDNAGWYNLGYKPGEAGSAVLSGHFDRADGSPAVFYNLNKLDIGDKIIVTDSQNKKYTFKVTDKKSFPYDQLPLKEIFASSGTSTLNLITCAGNWDKNAKNYSNRDVIYSKLQE